jgi:8-oxo-dGTP pyrophosphatase MutT (NUDIX family)
MTDDTQTTPWRRTSSRPIYENPWFRVREDQVIRPDGSAGIYGVVELPEYAGIVAVDDRGQVAMVRQWRYLYNEPSLEVPAGNTTPDDSGPLDTASRELIEETGLTAKTWTNMGRVRYSAVTNVGHLFLARDLAAAETRPESGDDWTNLLWLDYHDAISRVLSGEIMESTSVAALLKAEALRQRGEWRLPTHRDDSTATG